MNPLAERYVKLVLAMGQHDADYVDAYYGPPSGEGGRGEQAAARSDRQRGGGAAAVAGEPRLPRPAAEELVRLRHTLPDASSSSALRARVAMLRGRKLTFDEESKALYDAVAPTNDAATFERDPRGARQAAARLGIAARALRRVPQPVRDPARAARRDVQGGDRGLPQPDAAARHAAARRELHRRVRHEQELERLQLVSGPVPEPDPGEHRSADLRRPRDRSRLPRGLSRATTSTTCCSRRISCAIAAGSSSRCIRSSRRSRSSRKARRTSASTWRFPSQERLAFERSAIFPAAGLDPAGAAEYYEVLALVDRLSYAGNEAARRYINGADRREGRGRAGSSATRCTRRRARRSACASSTSTAAT